jgi:hypothetical protein
VKNSSSCCGSAGSGLSSFGKALEVLKSGGKIRRNCWLAGTYLVVENGVLMLHRNGSKVQELDSFYLGETLAEDWEQVLESDTQALDSDGLPAEKGKTPVYQFRIMYPNSNKWVLHTILRTEKQMKDEHAGTNVVYQKHAGPFYV